MNIARAIVTRENGRNACCCMPFVETMTDHQEIEETIDMTMLKEIEETIGTTEEKEEVETEEMMIIEGMIDHAVATLIRTGRNMMKGKG